MEKLLTVDEAADLLRVSTKTIKNWCLAKKIPCLKVGREWRLRPSELEAYLAGQRPKPTDEEFTNEQA